VSSDGPEYEEWWKERGRLNATAAISRSFMRVKFLDDRRGWAMGKGGKLIQTIDGGKHWCLGRN